MSERTVMQVLNAAVRGEVTAEQAAAELSSPYRSADVIAPRADVPSVLARIGAAVLPMNLGARWRWYRRAHGGRWHMIVSRPAHDASSPWLDSYWQQTEVCCLGSGGPLVFHFGLAYLDRCQAHGWCCCEVWP